MNCKKAQGNRNPFLDYPELIDYLWGSKYGQKWDPENGGGGNPEPPTGTVLLSEDFSTFPNTWEVKSVKGSNIWNQSKFDNETFAKISGYKKTNIDPENRMLANI